MVEKCPVCEGRGIVSEGFYENTAPGGYTCGTATVTCRSCWGRGYIVIHPCRYCWNRQYTGGNDCPAPGYVIPQGTDGKSAKAL